MLHPVGGSPYRGRPLLSLRDISPALRGNLPQAPARIFFEPRRSRRWGRLRPRPQTPAGPSFSSGRKGCKRPFRGIPPKDPQGERSGRVPHFTPTAGILGGRSRHIESRKARFLCRNILRFFNLLQYRTTARQAVSPVLGVCRQGALECNLSLFRADWAERLPRYGPSAPTLTSVDPL